MQLLTPPSPSDLPFRSDADPMFDVAFSRRHPNEMGARHMAALFNGTQLISPPALHGLSFSDNGNLMYDVAFYDTRSNPNEKGMRRAAALFNSSRVRFHALLSYPREIQGMHVTVLSLPDPARCIYRNLCRLSHGPGPKYLYKPLLHWVFSQDVKRIIVLDTDVVVIRPISELWAQFDHFGDAMIGIAYEQSRLYVDQHGKNYGTNGGVQLLDLEKMRASKRYAEALDWLASGIGQSQHGNANGRYYIGYLGDQTLYSYLAKSHPDLLYRLPCEWNRQLSMHFSTRNASVHACPQPCGVLHANFGPLKCVAGIMQSNPSCETWKQLRTGVALNNGALPMKFAKCPGSREREFRSFSERFFSDCCRA
uniref:Hexosyltransferase n=1 Tax=Coccolithus braarudii TaxID=221442 RepID=A0A7S0PZA7_9EUKA